MGMEIAQRYALSLFEVGKETNTQKDISEEVKAISDIFSSNEDFFKILTSPSVTKTEKDEAILSVFDKRISLYTLNFIRLLAERGRLINFKLIEREYIKLYNEENNIKEINAITAVPLSEDLFNKLKLKLEQITSKTVVLTNTVDSSILGGVMLKMDDDQADGSVLARLESLRAQLASIKA